MCLALLAAAGPMMASMAGVGAGASTAATAVGAISTAATVAGTAISAVGQYQKGQYDAKVMENNATTQRYMRDDAIRRGEVAESNSRLQTALRISEQRTAMAGRGADLQSDTPLGLIEDTAHMGELDALTIRTNAQREAWGANIQADNYSTAGSMARRSGNFGAGSTILATAANVSSDWLKINRPARQFIGVGDY